ncbi:sushi domain-containing protein 5 [Lates japonicus]|uniref:Sushi domain-containing protein 5 n=1 Tax=Lates japonicus TaxID=270547 RepID=A0AAD3NDD3_LATJO|nr:sushi domain-containing protein 5 [Lates japonicus]
MRDRFVLSLLFGCLACLVVTSVVNADGQCCVLDLRTIMGASGGSWPGLVPRDMACGRELRHAISGMLLPLPRGFGSCLELHRRPTNTQMNRQRKADLELEETGTPVTQIGC